jgi:ribosomal small subunit protein bTHX
LQPLNQQNLKTMGKGDKRSLRGKLFMSSYGNVRPKKGKKVKVQAPPPVQE